MKDTNGRVTEVRRDNLEAAREAIVASYEDEDEDR